MYGVGRSLGFLCRAVTDRLPAQSRVPAMKNIKIALTTLALTVPVLLPTVAEARATWT